MSLWKNFKSIFSDKVYTPPSKIESPEDIIAKKTEIRALLDKCDKIAHQINQSNSESDEKYNSICPMCESDNVVKSIKRLQGKIKGDFSGSGASVFGTGYNSSRGSIEGEFDTNEINKCNSCGNEWKIQETRWTRYKYERDIMESFVGQVDDLMLKVYDAKYETPFDPNDLEEKFNSKEEKIKDKLSDAMRQPTTFWKDVKIGTFEYFYNNSPYKPYKLSMNLHKNYYDKQILIDVFGMLEE